MPYIVGPPIQEDADYYRDDEALALDALGRPGTVVVGLPRSGKTSFLLRCARLARRRAGALPDARLHPEPMELRAWGIDAQAQSPAQHVKGLVGRPEPVLLLLDDADALQDREKWPPARVRGFANALRAHAERLRVVLARGLDVEDSLNWRPFAELTSEWPVVYLGPLGESEAEALVALARRPWSTTLGPERQRRVLHEAGRHPLALQARARIEADPAAELDLAYFGRAVLAGLREAQQDFCRKVWQNRRLPRIHASDLPERDLEALLQTGALALEGDAYAIGHPHLAGHFSAQESGWRQVAAILHLSDLHFGEQNADAELKARGPQILADSLAETLRGFTGADGTPPRPNLAVVSGDLSWRSHPDEMAQALAFLERLADHLAKLWDVPEEEARQRFVLVPGNHDACWMLSNGLTKSVKGGKLRFLEECRPWLAFSLGPYASLFGRFYQGRRWFDCLSPWQVYDWEDFDLSIVALSSCARIWKEGKIGFIEKEHVREAVRALPRRAFRLAVFHHNVEPVQEMGRDNLNDDYLHNKREVLPLLPVDACLHGHVHLPVVDGFKLGPARAMPCLGAGSFGVTAAHLPGDDHKGRVPRSFNVLSLEVNQDDEERRARLWSWQRIPAASAGAHAWTRGQFQGEPVPLG
jgi:hypothetical protein